MAREREIRFRVIEGDPPAGGRRLVQGYLLRGPITARVRIAEDGPARLNVKLPAAEGRHEFECWLPEPLAHALLRLPLPRVEKRRRREGRLEVDRFEWPTELVLVELELRDGEGPDLRDVEARRALMEAHRPAWVRAWTDVTDDPDYANARLARRRERGDRGDFFTGS
jgi:CYTH domain-containing protein